MKLHRRLNRLLPLVTLPLMLAVCVFLWLIINHTNYTFVNSDCGVWDLRSFDFSRGSARIRGAVEYIPDALLTPEEFEARAGEIRIGSPAGAAYSTCRLRILLPEGAVYAIAGNSIDYSDRIFINGTWQMDVGLPGESRETAVPDTAAVALTAGPVDGELVMVQQSANFVHRESGGFDDWYVGYPQVLRAGASGDVTLLILGLFLMLFLVHLTLYFILRDYKPNLYFALLCLIWFFRTGVTGQKVFSALLPWMSWYVKFRIEYLSVPLTGILMMLLFHALFPGVLPKPFRAAVCGVSGVFLGVFLFADTYLMSWLILGCYAYQGVAMLILAVCFALRLRSVSIEQGLSLAGVAAFLYAGVRDALSYLDLPQLPPWGNADFTQITMLLFVFLHMTAMFMATLQRAEQIKAVEQRLTAENAALDRVAHMKNEFIATISHETRTPLAVLSGYAELIAMQMRKKGVDEQTAADLENISTETQRIARIMDGMRVFTGEYGTEDRGKAPTRLGDLLAQAARLYAHIVERRNTELAVEVPEGLPQVLANPDEITQVLLNLLANAKNHTENGRITLSAAREGGFVVVTVADNGAGIDPALLPVIFERGRGGGGQGSGLGLSVCRQIIEEHGGAIQVDSALGVGTSVRFTLPVAEEDS